MKIKNKLLIFLTILSLFIPFQTFAYSNKVILGGENLGIEIESNGIIIVGFYKVNNKNINRTNNIRLGDKIIKVNNIETNDIKEMVKIIDKNINNNKDIVLTLKRDNKEIKTTLQLEKDKSGVYKTGLYVKDKITGIGTLTYIDPETKIYGALGHEIIEGYSNTKVEIKNGKIFESEIIDVIKSTSNKTGEKEATINKNEIYGNIKENTINGIYGTYTKEIENNLIDIAKETEIKEGKAYIHTVLEGSKKEKFEINIIGIDKNNKTKNILFEITDKNLLNKTNGVIKGMSGSPIVQNNKLIGAVTHAIQGKTNMGYGIFITTMLEEGDN